MPPVRASRHAVRGRRSAAVTAPPSRRAAGRAGASRFGRAAVLLSAALAPMLPGPPGLAGDVAGDPLAGRSRMVDVVEEGAHRILSATCANGLRAVAEQRPGSRTVIARIGVGVGSRDEDRNHAGISHLLEHLLFSEGHADAGRRAPDPPADPVVETLRAIGGIVNATTDFETTQYDADLPASHFEQGWDLLARLVTDARFDDDDVERERRIVLQEAALGKTDPLAIAAWSVLGDLFPGDPMGQPVIGFRRTLRRIRPEHLREHHARFYVPSNMFAVIAGDVSPSAAIDCVCGSLGRHPSPPAPRRIVAPPRARVAPSFTFRTLTRQAYLIYGALTSGETSADAPALKLLATILGGGRTSRLHLRLVDEEALTRDIEAIAFEVSDVGAFGCGVAVSPRDAGRAGEILREEMLRLAREPVGDDELEKARRLLLGGAALEFETNAGIAGFRAGRLRLGLDVSRDAWRREIETITPDALRDVAAATWGSGRARPGDGAARAADSGDEPPRAIVEIRILPARGFGKVIAALRYLLFRRL